jgi:hypothetical protein
VVRQAVIASSFGLRFQGQGYFLTDARTHRGTSGAPVVMHDEAGDAQLPWKAAVHERQPGQRPVIHVERTEVTKRRVLALDELR